MIYRFFLIAFLSHSVNLNANDLPYFSNYSPVKPGMPVPGFFSKFYGEVQFGAASVYWKLYEQAENTIFYVERSENGKDFKTLDRVNSADGINFQYKDTIPLTTGFYRIQALGKDTIYSDIMRLSTISGIPKTSVWPVFFDVLINVEVNSTLNETFAVVLTNSKGEVVNSRDITVEQGSAKIIFDDTISFLYPDEYTMTITGLQYAYSQKLYKK